MTNRTTYPISVSKLEDISQTECFVIVKATVIHYEGDKRSRTNPGHGYPAHTDHMVQVYEVFINEESFKDALALYVKQEQRPGNCQVRGFKFTPYITKTVVEVVVTP